jgi:photosystem II stability/assembly factor-like uncharacterized protein
MDPQTKLFFALFMIPFCLTSLSAQNNGTELYQPLSASDRPAYSEDLPEFAKMTFRPNLHLKAIEAAFEAYEKAKKNPKKQIAQENEVEDLYEVYFNRWKQAYEPFAQEDGTIVLPTRAEFKRHIQAQNRSFQNQLTTRSAAANWTLVGPNETHWAKWNQSDQLACPWQVNIYAFDIAPSNSSILYAAPETGGVFKTTDKGLNWTACAPNFVFGGTGSTLEIHPTDPNTVYLGINAFLYKTTDGGNTWTDLTNCNSSSPNDIAISPADPNLILVAANNGLFRSTDGGSTWTTVFSTACYDIEFNPSDATHVFILKTNGTNVEFLKSTDSGASFAVKSTGTTALLSGRLAVTAADANRIYLLCTASPNPPRLMKSLDEGETWADMNPTFCTGGVSDATGGQGYYDLSIAASQTNANELLFGMCSTAKAVSSDGGNTFTFSHIGGYCGSFPIHPDLQEVKCIWNGSQLETWIATDGGFTFSTDFFSNTSNAAARNNGIYSTNFWGFGQGWNEDIMVGGRYHNGNTALADFFPAGKALRMGGAEAGTGYVFHGQSRTVAFSDSEDKVLPSSFTGDDYANFSYSKFPNEDGYGYNASPFLIHPNYFKHQYFGEGNTFWKTTDNGLTFVALNDFGSRVRRYEMSRSNPSVIYLATDAGFHKSTNGGTSWSSMALPSGRSSGSLYISINPTDENDVWITFENVSASSTTGKVYQSTNGGSSWTDKTSSVLSGKKIKNIVHTGGGIYISAHDDQGFVYYRSISATNWTDFSTNLLPSMDILSMKPFYRDGKMRVAGNRGIWETPLESEVAPVALPMVDKPATTCPKDTFYFDDYSILKHVGATWAWSFSTASNPSFTPQYLSSVTARNPKVVFGAVGKYTVTLTVTNSAGTSTKTVTDMIDVTSDGNCDLSTVIGKAMLSTTDGDYLKTAMLDLNKTDGSPNNEITLMAWVKPTGIQSSYAGILSCVGINVNLNFRNNNELGIHWNDGNYNWSSGLTVPADEWSHVALVVTPTQFRLYLNGKEAINTTTVTALHLANREWYLGIDRGNSSRTYKGLIDEAAFFNRSLSKEEIWEKMHLMKDPATDVALKGYYQFNETTGVVWNKSKLNNSSFTGSVTRVVSTAPVAVGTSQRMSITTSGAKDFTTQNLSLTFPNTGALPNGDVVVTELNAAPDQTPSNNSPLNTKYWIIENYGANTAFAPLTNIEFKNLAGFATGTASDFKLYQRSRNADGATWGTPIDNGETVSSGSITFSPASNCNSITAFGQFGLTNDASTAIFAPCLPNTIPSQAVSFTGVGTSNAVSTAAAPNWGTTQPFTIALWFKSNSTASYATLISDKDWDLGRNKGWVIDLESGKIRFNIGDGTDRIDLFSQSGLNDNNWHHVAVSFTRVSGTTASVVLYIDGVNKAATAGAVPIGDVYSGYKLYMGVDVENDYPYSGSIDEVKIWNTALTQDQIREKRHLTAAASEPNLVSYYQFNESVGMGNDFGAWANALSFSATATRPTSTAPVGGGTSQRLSVTTSGLKDFADVDLSIEFPSTGALPNGELVVTKLNVSPDQNPTIVTPFSKYWIVNNYGTSAFAALTSIRFKNLGTFATNTPSNYKLFKRASNADGSTWGTAIDVADSFSTDDNKTLTFSTDNNITSFSQLALGSEAVLAVELLSFQAILEDKQVDLTWRVADERDVSHYIVERSSDGKRFEAIARLNKGIFSTRDSNPYSGSSYYRLKIVEKDDKSTYSAIKSVYLEQNEKGNYQLFPNPSHSILNVKFEAAQQELIDFELVNAVGQVVHSYRLESKIGENHLFFRVNRFATGFYTLRIRQNNRISIEKVVIE